MSSGKILKHREPSKSTGEETKTLRKYKYFKLSKKLSGTGWEL